MRRDTEWFPLKPKLVGEFQYDHFSGGRFRHGTKFLRWRPEKKPEQCTMEQIRPEKGGLAATAARHFPATHSRIRLHEFRLHSSASATTVALPKAGFRVTGNGLFLPYSGLGSVARAGALLTFVFGLMKSSEPYQHAVAVASSNPDVVRELGAPIAPAGSSGNINVSGSSGDANLAIPLNGSSPWYCVCRRKKTDGVWSYDKLEMLVEGHDSAFSSKAAAAKGQINAATGICQLRRFLHLLSA